MKRHIVFMLAIIVAISAIDPIFGEDRIAEGAKDLAKGVASIPQDIANTANDSNIINGVVAGTAKGLLNAAKGIGEGIFKILTFYNEKGAN